MIYSEQKKQLQTLNRRAFFLLLSNISLFSVVGWRLFDIQILDSEKYQTLSKNNQIKLQLLAPLRGEILDRNGKKLATNKLVYDLYLIPEQTNNIEKTLKNLNNFVKIDYKKKREIINLIKKNKKFESIKVLENLNWDKLELIETNKNALDGLHLLENYQRIYPQGEFYGHIIGYINKPSKNDHKLHYISQLPNLNVGKRGIERSYNDQLIGKPGQKEIEVNAKGRLIREISNVNSIKGINLGISIDLDLQKFTQKEINKHKAGSIVVLNIESGELFSMVSTPTFDPNLIIKKPNEDYWKSLIENSLSPLTNRSIQGLYAPGSTFKMVVALAGLKHNLIDSSDSEFCEGKIEYGDRFYHCWKEKGHGRINLEKAIKESCDVYFYKLALKIGIDKISNLAREFGLGQDFEIGIEGEKAGIIPTKKWKKENLNETWYAGETLNAGIGQGYTLCNPLQLAVMTARIASNGMKVVPTLIKNKDKKNFDKMKINLNHISLIKDAMFKVVNEFKGTANKSKSEKFLFSGKTGTSQVKRISIEERESEDFRKKEIEWKNKDHALFVGYMPSENPKFAISIVVEHGGSGASTAAPIANKIFNYLYSKKI